MNMTNDNPFSLAHDPREMRNNPPFVFTDHTSCDIIHTLYLLIILDTTLTKGV